MTHSIVPQLISALGEPQFAAVAAGELSKYLGFDLSAIVVHRRAQRPAVLFDNFDRVGCREGQDQSDAGACANGRRLPCS